MVWCTLQTKSTVCPHLEVAHFLRRGAGQEAVQLALVTIVLQCIQGQDFEAVVVLRLSDSVLVGWLVEGPRCPRASWSKACPTAGTSPSPAAAGPAPAAALPGRRQRGRP